MNANAQKTITVKGNAKTEEGKPLSRASVSLYYPGGKDTLKTVTTDKGNYIFNNVKPTKAVINISYIGYKKFTDSYDYTNAAGEEINNEVIMTPGDNLLETVTIESAKIQIKEDTVSYKIDSTMFRKNDNVEEVLRKLPGVQVDKDGKITAQGKEVTKVKVNGKEFFGGDVKTATRELNADMVDKTIMWPYRVAREKQYIRFITSGFLHADWMHLIFNMFTLFFFGRNLELYFNYYGLGGNLSYLALYFLGLIVSDIPSYIKHKDDYNYRSLGASGAVSAVIFATIIFSPWSSIYIYGALKISAAVYAVLYILYCVYMGKRNGDNVNHDAHLWGSLFGLAFTLILIGVLNPALFTGIIEQLKHPSLFGTG